MAARAGRADCTEHAPDWRLLPRGAALCSPTSPVAAQGLSPKAVHLMLFSSIGDIAARRPRASTGAYQP